MLKLLREFAAGKVTLEQLEDGFSTSDVVDNISAIMEDPKAAEGLAMAVCANRAAAEGEEDEFMTIGGYHFPIAGKLDASDDAAVWKAMPGILREFCDNPGEGNENDARAAEIVIPGLVKSRYLNTTFWRVEHADDETFDESAAWTEKDFWSEEAKATADKNGSEVAEEEPAEAPSDESAD